MEGSYDFIDVSSVPLTEETISTLHTQLLSLEDINEFLFKIGCCFVGNKSQLALWIKGLQGAFAQLYVLSKLLLSEAKELTQLKDFLVITVENLKQRVHDLMNEKEDLAAMHQSDSGVKEHLIERVNELERVCMEQSTELVFTRRSMDGVRDERQGLMDRAEEAERELREVRAKSKTQLGLLKDHARKVSAENEVLTEALTAFKAFFDNVNL